MSGQFAFINPEGEAATVRWDEAATAGEVPVTLISRDDPALDPDGKGRPVAFAGPTWSPDGSRLALSALYETTPQRAGARLLLIDPARKSGPRLLYEGTPGLGARIAPGIPHYVNWSPSGERLAVLAQTVAGMAVILVDAAGASAPVTLITGAPLFTAWSPDGGRLLIHRGPDLFILDVAAPADLQLVVRNATAFQVPAWSPVGERFAYVRRAGAGSALTLMDLDGRETSLHESPFGFAALGWSPLGDEILFSPLQSSRPARFRGLWLIGSDGKRKELLTDEPLVAFHWSPDGSSVAYLTPTLGHRRLNWNMIEPATRQTHRFPRFYPAPEFSLTVSFFEQYGLSHRSWSPDGSAFLVNGRILENGTSPDLAPNTLYVQPARAQAHAIAVAKGAQASWRPGG